VAGVIPAILRPRPPKPGPPGGAKRDAKAGAKPEPEIPAVVPGALVEMPERTYTQAEWDQYKANYERRLAMSKGEADTARQDYEALKFQVRQDHDKLKELAAEKNKLEHMIANLRTQVRESGASLRQARRAAEAAVETRADLSGFVRDRFADPERQLRWEIYAAWVQRYGPAEKEGAPLPADSDYDIGAGFIATLEALQGVDRGKVIDVIVEVLTGDAASQSGRKVHQLRESSGGGTKTRRRPEDGAIGWRAAIQRGSPAARALHYWKKGDRIELDQVGVHDDDLR
jgi:hypothetical protein